MLPNDELVIAIKKRREDLEITQEHLSELADVGLRTLKSLESGRGNPTLHTVFKLLDVLGLSLEVRVKELDL